MSKIFYNLLFIDVVLAALMTAAGLCCFGFFLHLIQTPAEIMEQAMLYGKIYMLFLPCQMVYDVSRQLIIGVGESASPMRMVILTTFLNVILDLLMVPFWGITGAVVATGIAEFVGLVLVCIRLKKQYLIGHFHLSLLSGAYGKEILHLAPPNALQQASGTVVTLVKQGLLGGLGAMAIAGFSCATKTITFMMMPIFGFAQALVVFYAQNLVAGNHERVAKAKRLSYLVTTGYVCVVAAVSYFLSGPLMAMFTTETEAIRYGVLILTFEPIGQFLYGLRVMNEAQLRGRRRMGCFLASSVGTMAMNIVCCLILVRQIGFSGFYIAGYISGGLGLILSAYLAKYAQRLDSLLPNTAK